MKEKIGTIDTTKKIINENDFFIKKKFGQNFIIDQNILNNIIEVSNINSESYVIEIGPGLGSLTELIAKKAKKLLCYEIDKDLIPILHHNLDGYKNVEILNMDILKANVNEDIIKYLDDKEVTLIANLPYYITTPIITKLLEETNKIKTYIMMMQDEVADRICSKPSVKDYNALSIAIQYKAKATKELNISRNIFIPKPNVDSAVIKLSLYETLPYKASNEEFFFKLIRGCFMQRRKTLYNNLVNMGINKELALDSIMKLNFSSNVRSEELSIQDFINLSNLLS